MRGRKPKPTARQIAEGDPRKKGVGKLNEKLAAEPKTTRGLPPCPRHLRGRARAAWNFWAEELATMNLDSRPDAMMLEGACVNFARAIKADLACEEFGEVVKEPIVSRETNEIIGVRFKKNPWASISERAWLITKAFCSEFGLSPVSRTRLTIEKHDDGEQDLATLLSAPRVARPAVN